MVNDSEGRQFSRPLFIDRLDDTGTARALDKISVGRGEQSEIKHNEAWLQKLIHDFPQVLPIREIEPGFSQLIPVCIELPTPAGYVDNLYVTATGDLVLAECKLWRNPQARREVVAQIIDYAQSMARWSYSDLENAVERASSAQDGEKPVKLFQLVEGFGELDEIDFTDAISRNLRLGRVLLLIIGDGIREGVESLADYLQGHAGFHFTLGIVEMPVYRLPHEGFVVQPRVLARTVNIERGIVRVRGSNVVVEPPIRTTPNVSAQRRTSISQERLFELLAEEDPQLPSAVDRFLEHAAEVGIKPAMAPQSLQLRWLGPNNMSFSLGGIASNGDFNTYNVNWTADSIGQLNLAHDYLKNLATLLGGEFNKSGKPTNWHVVVEGQRVPKTTAVLEKQEGWLKITHDYIESLSGAIRESEIG